MLQNYYVPLFLLPLPSNFKNERINTRITMARNDSQHHARNGRTTRKRDDNRLLWIRPDSRFFAHWKFSSHYFINAYTTIRSSPCCFGGWCDRHDWRSDQIGRASWSVGGMMSVILADS